MHLVIRTRELRVVLGSNATCIIPIVRNRLLLSVFVFKVGALHHLDGLLVNITDTT
jgi:hypothetical protein